jgi:hypothetical protein
LHKNSGFQTGDIGMLVYTFAVLADWARNNKTLFGAGSASDIDIDETRSQ